MPRINCQRKVIYSICLSLVASISLWALPAGAQLQRVDSRENPDRVAAELAEKRSEALGKDELSKRITRLLKLKRDVLRDRYEMLLQLREQGVINPGFSSFDSLRRAHADWIDAELELTTIPAQRIKLLRENVESAVDFERNTIALSAVGADGGNGFTVSIVRAARYDAELRLARELVDQQGKDSK